MKKTILVALIIMVSSPCLAQEVEPNLGLFPLSWTLWEIRRIPNSDEPVGYLGFALGRVYNCGDKDGNDCYVIPISLYLDLYQKGLPSIFFYSVGPIGIGWTIPVIGIGGGLLPMFCKGCGGPYVSLIKIDDFWTPLWNN